MSAAVAQLAEHRICNPGVEGSIPFGGLGRGFIQMIAAPGIVGCPVP